MSLLSLGSTSLGLNSSSIYSDAHQTETLNSESKTKNKLNFLTLKIEDGICYFNYYEQDWELFKKGETLTVSEFESNEIFNSPSGIGTWNLHRSNTRGHPSVICSCFNKRTQMMDQRYTKVFYKDGIYRCGPRFPKQMKY